MTKNRILAGFLVLAAWLTSLCLWMPPSHACCKPAQHAIQKTLPPCCLQDNAVTVQDHSGSTGPLPTDWASAIPFDYKALLNWAQAITEQSRQDLAYWPDQSKRYLELRVLLT